LDAKLRSGNKTMSDAEMERTLDEALELFRYTHGAHAIISLMLSAPANL
jgi:hypothetical protein